MHTGFLVTAGAGESTIKIYGAVRPGRIPLVSEHGDADGHAVVMGRLCYRADLIGRLGLVAPAAPDNDAALALASYRKFGRAGIEALEGEHAMAILDRKQRRLVASRDPMGGYPIYWLQRGETVALATGLRPLVDLLATRNVDTGFLAELQMLPFAEVDYYDGTPFEGIRRLVPDSLLDVDLASAKAGVVKFWDWSARAVDPGTDDVGAIAERYRALLSAAVRERAVGVVAAHLSGGMDSTTVAYLAADATAREGRSVHALSLDYLKLSGLDHEKPYLEAALDRAGIVAHRIPADDLLDYDLFRDAPLHDEPYSGLFRIGVDIAMNKVAAEAGADTVMSGFGADELLATAPFYIADLMKRGRLLAAWSEAGRWSKAHTTSIWKFLRPFALMPLMPVWLQPGLGPLFRGGYASWTRQNHYTIAPWVKREFAHQGRMQQRGFDQVRREYRSHRSMVRSESLARLRMTSGDWARYNLAVPLGFHQSHPFRDLRVMAFGLGTRDRVRPVPGQQKVVLAKAMEGILPEKILRRRVKGHFNSLFYAGLTRNLPYLEAMVRESKVDEMGLFDKEQLIACMRDAAVGGRSLDGVIGLNNTLGIVKWLQMLPRWLAHRPEPVRVIGGDTHQRAAPLPAG